MVSEVWADTKVLNLWQYWSERVHSFLGEEWREDNTGMTMALLFLFKSGKTPGEAVAIIRATVALLSLCGVDEMID